jgi:hypothetical protein
MATRHKTLEYLATTRIGEKGQLTVPKQFREDLGLGAVRHLLYCGLAMASYFSRRNSVSSSSASKLVPFLQERV